MPLRRYLSVPLFLLAFFFAEGNVLCQVVVEKSKDKVIISGKPYYIHIVRKGETAYSISRAYYLTVDDLARENPSASKGIREGQSLRIPVVDPPSPKNDPQEKPLQKDDSKYIYHRLSSGDTVYSLARRFGVSEQEILQSNPGVEINKLSIGTEIAIPRRVFTTTSQKLDIPPQEKEYVSHRVEKGESLASIAEKYGVSVRELRRENKGLIFPKVDEYIRIPVLRIAETQVQQAPVADSAMVTLIPDEKPYIRPAGHTQVNKLRGRCNVAVLLPLYFAENARRSEIDSSTVVKGKKIYKTIKKPEGWIYERSLPFLELYHGILIAADTLRSLGLDVNLTLFDIRSDSLELKRVIESGQLEEMDLIIGPWYPQNLLITARYASEHKIPVASMVPLRSGNIIRGNPMIYMTNPSLELAQEVIAGRAGENYADNFVFIHQDSAGIDPSVTGFKNKIFRELNNKSAPEDIKFRELLFYSRSMLSNDSINRLEHTLSDKSENFVIIASEEPAVLSETLMDLHSLSKKYNIKVVGLPGMRDLKNLEPKIFFDLGLELYSPFWIDYLQKDVMEFIKSYRKKFLAEPPGNSLAWQGYDIAYYFLSGLSLHGKEFLESPEMHYPDLIETDYEFIRPDVDSGFENRKLFLIRYTGEMDIVVLNEGRPAAEPDK